VQCAPDCKIWQGGDDSTRRTTSYGTIFPRSRPTLLKIKCHITERYDCALHHPLTKLNEHIPQYRCFDSRAASPCPSLPPCHRLSLPSRQLFRPPSSRRSSAWALVFRVDYGTRGHHHRQAGTDHLLRKAKRVAASAARVAAAAAAAS